MIIYLITNQINNKQYVGQTTGSLKRRWRRHIYHSKVGTSAINKAIKKYGEESFTIAQLSKASSIEELNELEIKYIAYFNTLAPQGYNLDSGGKNKIMHSETKEKIRKALKGKAKTLEHKDCIRASKTGHIPWNKGRTGVYSKETLEKIGKASSLKIPWNKGLKHSEETRTKMRNNHRDMKDVVRDSTGRFGT